MKGAPQRSRRRPAAPLADIPESEWAGLRKTVRRDLRGEIEKGDGMDVKVLARAMALDAQLALDQYDRDGTPGNVRHVLATHQATMRVLTDAGLTSRRAPERDNADFWKAIGTRLAGATPEVKALPEAVVVVEPFEDEVPPPEPEATP